MNATLRRLANNRHAALALEAFSKYRGLVATGRLSKDKLRNSITSSKITENLEKSEIYDTIYRAFKAAKHKRSQDYEI